MVLNKVEKQLGCCCGVRTRDDEALKCSDIEGKRAKQSSGDLFRQQIWQEMLTAWIPVGEGEKGNGGIKSPLQFLA